MSEFQNSEAIGQPKVSDCGSQKSPAKPMPAKMERISSGRGRREFSCKRVEPPSPRLQRVRIPSRREHPSQFSNFFDLKLGEAVAHGLPSFDCYGLGSVVSHLGVNRMADFASQQIHFSILSFDSSRQAASDAVSGAFG